MARLIATAIAAVAVILVTAWRRRKMWLRWQANVDYGKELDAETALRRDLERENDLPRCPGTRASIDRLTAALHDQRQRVGEARAKRDRIK